MALQIYRAKTWRKSKKALEWNFYGWYRQYKKKMISLPEITVRECNEVHSSWAAISSMEYTKFPITLFSRRSWYSFIVNINQFVTAKSTLESGFLEMCWLQAHAFWKMFQIKSVDLSEWVVCRSMMYFRRIIDVGFIACIQYIAEMCNYSASHFFPKSSHLWSSVANFSCLGVCQRKFVSLKQRKEQRRNSREVSFQLGLMNSDFQFSLFYVCYRYVRQSSSPPR
jgi:hypothetical protein